MTGPEMTGPEMTGPAATPARPRRRRTAGPDVPEDNPHWLAVARAAKGFMPDDEGMALHRAGLVAGKASGGPFVEVGHLLREVSRIPGSGRQDRPGTCCSASTITTARRSCKQGGRTMTREVSTG